jgi:V8-like Glu-specific endopeptidase
VRQGRRTRYGLSGRELPGARVFLAGLVALIATASFVSPAAAGPAIAEHTVKSSPEKVVNGWTTADLLAAKPAEMPEPPAAAFDVPDLDASVSAQTGDFYPSDPTTYPERLQGKVFFTAGGTLFQCSGTLVSSRKGNIVYTAGHCVWNKETKTWSTDFVFIPGYQDGTSPYATYPATALSSPQGYIDRSDFSYDIGMATLAGNPQADLGGSRQIAFDLNPVSRKYTIYGYPALPAPPYDGQRLVGCRSQVALRDSGTSPQPMGVKPCNMKQGASGGGWITNGNYLNSITSYTYCDSDPELCGLLFGPYFSKAAKALYTSSSSSGSITPTVKLKFAPPKTVTKRKVIFKFGGTGSTPISFLCKYDRRQYVSCGARTPISRLTAGRHTLKVRSVDQTGRKSKKTITRSFRVLRHR